MSELAQQIEPVLNGTRQARGEDIYAISMLGYEALKKHPAPRQVLSSDKLRKLAEVCVSDPKNFAWVGVKDGEVVAALCALVHPQMVYERHQASVVQWYSREPGYGGLLMRRFVHWYRGIRRIKCACLVDDVDIDARMARFLERIGFARSSAWTDWK